MYIFHGYFYIFLQLVLITAIRVHLMPTPLPHNAQTIVVMFCMTWTQHSNVQVIIVNPFIRVIVKTTYFEKIYSQLILKRVLRNLSKKCFLYWQQSLSHSYTRDTMRGVSIQFVYKDALLGELFFIILFVFQLVATIAQVVLLMGRQSVTAVLQDTRSWNSYVSVSYSMHSIVYNYTILYSSVISQNAHHSERVNIYNYQKI